MSKFRARLAAAFTLAAVAYAAFAVGTAGAAVFTSNVTTPAGPYFAYIWNPTTGTIDVAGTASTPNSTVDIACHFSSGDLVLHSGVPTGASGRWSVTLANSEIASMADYGETCTLAAVPHMGVTSATTTGPALLSGGRLDNQYGGKTVSIQVYGSGTGGHFEYSSIAGSGVSLYLETPGVGNGYDVIYDAAQLWDGSAGELQGAPAPGAVGVRVDGVPAFSPFTLERYIDAPATPGYVEPTMTTALDPATGVQHDVLVEPLLRCAPDAAAVEPTAAGCSSVVPSGVRLVRTFDSSADGRSATSSDAWTSADGAAHGVETWMVNHSRSHGGSTFAAYQFPGQPAFARTPTTRTVLAGSTAPATVFLRDDDAPADGSTDASWGSITTSSAPAEYVLTGASHGATSDDGWFEHRTLAVPATGATTVRTTFGISSTIATLRASSRGAEDAYGVPTVAFTTPAAGAVSGVTAVTLTGRASDNVGVTALSINGAAVPLAADGSFALPVSLALGTTTFTATVRDAAGNVATDVRALRFAPPLPVQKLSFGTLPALAKALKSGLVVRDAINTPGTVKVQAFVAVKVPKRKHHKAYVKLVLVGSGTASAKVAPTTLAVKVTFTRSFQRAARNRATQPLRIVATATNAAGQHVAKVSNVTLRAPRRHH